MDQPSQSLRVGIADDIKSARLLLTEMLESLGHQVIFQAKSGRELVEACGKDRPDLVVTDNVMPDLLGVEAAAEIYRRFSIPVILLSAYSDPEVVLTAEHKHVSVYLVKPLDKSNLETAIAIALRSDGDSQSDEGYSTTWPRGADIDETVSLRRTHVRFERQPAAIR